MEIVAYKNTLYDLMPEQVKGKYFQNILDPTLIIYIPERFGLVAHPIEQDLISVWVPLIGEEGGLSHIKVRDFPNYAEISKEQFEKYKSDPSKLLNVLLSHENSEARKNPEQSTQIPK